MRHRITPTSLGQRWTLCGIALVLVMIVAACGSEGVPPAAPSQVGNPLATSNPVPVPLPYPPPIEPTGGAFSIDGEYQLTLTASPRCSLPAEVRQRTYTARVTEAKPGYLTVTLSGAGFPVPADGTQNGFEGMRNRDALRFVIYNGYGGEYWFIENTDGTRNLFVEGVASATIGDGTIAGTFVGELRYFVPGQPWIGYCSAADHHMTFVR